MNKPTHKQLDAIVKLYNEDAFKVFVQWISESMINQAMISVDVNKEPDRAWMQGRVQELRYLLKEIQSARASLAAVEQNKEA